MPSVAFSELGVFAKQKIHLANKHKNPLSRGRSMAEGRMTDMTDKELL
jgi:hypothetical protein